MPALMRSRSRPIARVKSALPSPSIMILPSAPCSLPDGTLSPTLIVIAASFRSVLLDMENRLAGDPPLAQQRTDTGEIAPAMLRDDRPQRAIGDQPGEQCQIEAETVLGLRSEIMEG